MKSGDLDRRIILERATVATNGFNEEVKTWTALATVWASYKPVSDGEKSRAGEISSGIMSRFQIRYSTTVSSLDTRDRIVFDGRTWEIHGVKEMQRRVGLEITAMARGERE